MRSVQFSFESDSEFLLSKDILNNQTFCLRIVRIVLVAAFFAIFNFFALAFYGAANFLVPVPELYECLALVALYLLLVAYVIPEVESRPAFFNPLHRVGNNVPAAVRAHGKGFLRWIFINWVLVFQILPGRFATTIAAEVVEALLCPASKSYRLAHAVIAIVQAAQTIVCVMGILRFHHRLRSDLRRHGVVTKLIVFKLIVIIQLVQRIIFTTLALRKKLHPSKYVSYLDWTVGLVPFLTCIEVLIFSVILLWPFSNSPYLKDGMLYTPQGAKLGLGAALLDAIDIRDIFKGIQWRVKLMEDVIIHGEREFPGENAESGKLQMFEEGQET